MFWMFTDLPRVTRVLLIVNTAVFLLQQLFDSSLLAYFALWPLGEPQLMADGSGSQLLVGFQLWQLLTYSFLHGGLMHLAFNMLALIVFGAPIERAFGSRVYTLLLFRLRVRCGRWAIVGSVFLE